MFRDLKEYQEIQNLYESQVYLSEEEENELFDIVESFDLTDEELEYFVENLEEFSEDQDLQEIKNIKSTFNTLSRLKGGKFGGGMKTGIDLSKSAKRANLKNMLGRKPFDPVGKKFSGPVNLNKFTSIKDKLKTNAKRLAIAGGGVGTIALARQLGKGSDVEKEKEKKKIENKVKDKTITKVKPITAGSTDAEGKKIPSTDEIRSKSDGATSAGNAGSSTDSGGTAGPQKTETKPNTTDTKTKEKDTKTKESKPQTEVDRIAATPRSEIRKSGRTAMIKKNIDRLGKDRVQKLQDKNRDFQAMKKGKMTKQQFIDKYPQSITAQRSKGLRDQTEWDAYDLVLEYLMSTEQVATIEEANYVMMQLDKENIQEIVGGAVKGLKAIGRFGAKNPVNFAATLGGAGVVGQTVVKPIAQTLGKMTAPKVETPKVQTSTNDIQVGSGIDARQPGESLLDYAKRRKKSLETQDRKLGAGEY